MSERKFTDIEARLTELQLVPVVSLPSVDAGLRLAELLIKCHLPVVEVTFRTSIASEAIRAMKQEFDDLLILAGTVLSAAHLDSAVDSGAECIVIPGFYKELVKECQARRIMVCPGVVTPSEVLQCMSLGLSRLKFFPAEVAGGIGMLKAMAAVFADIRFMPTGGVNPQNVADYLALDTVFCCGGSWLAPENLLAGGQWNEIENRITSAQTILAQSRRESD